MNRSQTFDSPSRQQSTVPFGGLVAAAFGAFAAAVAAVNRGIVYRRTASALSRLDDHMLRDIGVTRAEITHVARNLADG